MVPDGRKLLRDSQSEREGTGPGMSSHVNGIRCHFRLRLIKLASLRPESAIRFSAIDPALVR